MVNNLKPVNSLQSLCLGTVVDHIDLFIAPYIDRWNEISDENRPRFGLLGCQPPLFLVSIIEMLLKRKNLKYEYLKVLLPEQTKWLPCESTEYISFQTNLINVIFRRCKDLEILHYHFYDRSKIEFSDPIQILNDSLLKLKKLREIDFSDSFIEDETLRIITLNCDVLEKLNLRKTEISEQGFSYLYSNENVFKNTLTKLFVDQTNISAHSIGQCLLYLKNLTYIQSDCTIRATFDLLRSLEISKMFSGVEVPKFKSTLLKNNFQRYDVHPRTPNDATLLTKIFPDVSYLIFTSVRSFDIRFINNIIIMLNITHLDLSSSAEFRGDGSFRYLRRALDNCSKSLISLKLENFENVNIYYIGKTFKKLKRLSLINNTFSYNTHHMHPNLFKNLTNFEILVFKKEMDHFSYKAFLNREELFSILSSTFIENVVIYHQFSLTHCLFVELINKGYLKHLRGLSLYHCTFVYRCFIEELICNLMIEKLEVGLCPFITENTIEYISNFIKKRNLPISISFVREFPYRLQKNVLNIPISSKEIYERDAEDFYIGNLYQ